MEAGSTHCRIARVQREKWGSWLKGLLGIEGGLFILHLLPSGVDLLRERELCRLEEWQEIPGQIVLVADDPQQLGCRWTEPRNPSDQLKLLRHFLYGCFTTHWKHVYVIWLLLFNTSLPYWYVIYSSCLSVWCFAIFNSGLLYTVLFKSEILAYLLITFIVTWQPPELDINVYKYFVISTKLLKHLSFS